MAFKIVDSEDVSMLMRPADLKSFIGGRDPEPQFALPLPPEEAMRGIRRNLQFEMSKIGNEEEETVILPPPSAKEMVRVFLRIKPRTDEESHYYSIASQDNDSTLNNDEPIPEVKEDNSIVSLESVHQLAITAPPDSAAYKNSVNGQGKLTHRFTFTRIFPHNTEQSELFCNVVKPRLQDFLEGRNQLLFTYGATCSGKTFTIQGDSSRPGILPRALDVLFNSTKNRLMQPDDLNIKPLGYNRVATLKPGEQERTMQEKKSIFEMGTTLSQFMDTTDQLSSEDSQTSIASLRSRLRDNSEIDLGETTLHYGVWVSFAEIYNENIYDLFEKIPEVKNKNDKPRRAPLKLADDKGNSTYIKGLKEVYVSSADEAYQLLLIGRQNLQFAATRLNHHSSRSHCIFTIKIVRVVDKDNPQIARVSMLSFCDLAGSERIKKTLNTGERQREAGNINTSLLVLGRCIKAIRSNQPIKDAKKKQIVPFRESKLTRLFQSYFSGSGKVSMIVNVSQSPYLFDETLQVLKFSAIASKVQIKLIKEPAPVIPESKQDKAKRKTRFSILVENNEKSLCRGSIAWENPQFRSTICPRPGLMSDPDSTVLEETEIADTTNLAEETVIDSKYDGLLKVIENLKNQLIEEKQKNLKVESETRTELCEEFNKMLVEVETSWEQRLQEEKDRASELSDWRISKLEEALREKSKRTRLDSSTTSRDDQYEERLNDKEKELNQLQEELDAIKTLHSSTLEKVKKYGEETEKLRQELRSTQNERKEGLEKLKELQKEFDSTAEALKQQSSDPRINELENSVKELKEKLAKEGEQITSLKTLLDEAGEDYLAKDKEIKSLNIVLNNQMVSLYAWKSKIIRCIFFLIYLDIRLL